MGLGSSEPNQVGRPLKTWGVGSKAFIEIFCNNKQGTTVPRWTTPYITQIEGLLPVAFPVAGPKIALRLATSADEYVKCIFEGSFQSVLGDCMYIYIYTNTYVHIRLQLEG